MAKWHTEKEWSEHTDQEYEIGQELWGVGKIHKVIKYIPIKMIITGKSTDAGIWKYKYSFKFENKNLEETDYWNEKPRYINKEDAIKRAEELNEYYKNLRRDKIYENRNTIIAEIKKEQSTNDIYKW